MTLRKDASVHKEIGDGKHRYKDLKREETPSRRLDIVLKCDSFGSEEAVLTEIEHIQAPGVKVRVIHKGVGTVSKSDLMMALTGSRLVVGFNVGVMPKLQLVAKEQEVEVRLYDVIYRLAEDLSTIANSLTTPELGERITGCARVIALFKTSPGGIILGCRVEDGSISLGKNFRIIGAAGTIYTGRIESLQINRRPVNEAKTGQEAGLKVKDFKNARLGDLVECFEKVLPRRPPEWKAHGSILHQKV